MDTTTGLDRKLPALEKAQDNRYMILHLTEVFKQSQGETPFVCQSVKHKILKYKPGKTGVILYQVNDQDGSNQPEEIIGKIYRFDRAQRINDYLSKIWCTIGKPIGDTPAFGMAKPLGSSRELGMAFQEKIDGVALEDVKKKDLSAAMKHTGRNLAILHESDLDGPEKSITDHITKYCHPGPDSLLQALPHLQAKVDALRDGILMIGDLANHSPVPSHGDLNISQIFIKDERAFFIDFDGFCLTYAGLDVGNFMVTLEVRFPDSGQELSDCFLQAYLKQRNCEEIPELKYCRSFAYLRRAMICFRKKEKKNWPAEVERLLDCGLACLQNSLSR